MATLASTVKSDIEVFKFLQPKAYPKKAHLNKEILNFVKDGVIQVETLYEKALSVQGKLKRDSVYGQDFSDGSDAKKCIAATHTATRYRKLVNGRYGKYLEPRHIAKIGRIKNKCGLLRILVHEPIQNKFYFFKIPYAAYEHLTHAKFSSINIHFNVDGTIGKSSKWEKYRVNSFKALAS